MSGPFSKGAEAGMKEFTKWAASSFFKEQGKIVLT